MANKMVNNDPIAQSVCDLFGNITGACASKVIYDVVENLVPGEVAISTKIAYGVGSYALGWVVGDQVAEHMYDVMADMGESVLGIKKLITEPKKSDN